MDLSHLLQKLRQERKGHAGLQPRSLLRALKQMIAIRSRTRRNNGVQALDRPESLEVRQVLSAVSPVDYSAPLVESEQTFVDGSILGPGLVSIDPKSIFFPTDAVQQDLVPDGFVLQMVRDQLSKSLSPTNLMPEMSIEGEIARIPNSASINRGPFDDLVLSDSAVSGGNEVAASENIDTELSEPIFNAASDQLNLSILIEYSDGPQEVTVETISSTNLQIRVSGLAGTIYESSGTEFTTDVLYWNAMAVLQRVQPNRPVQILFPATSLDGRERIPTIPEASINDRLHTDSNTESSSPVAETPSGSNASKELPDLLVPGANSQATARADSDEASLIDQVFAVSELTLDNSILVSLGVTRIQQTLSWSQSDSGSSILQQQEISAAAGKLKHELESAPDPITTMVSHSGLAKLVRRGLSWLRPGRLPGAVLVSNTVISEFFARFGIDSNADSNTDAGTQNPVAEGVEWLSWLLRSSSEPGSVIRSGPENGIHHSEFVPDAVPVFSNAVEPSRDMRGVWNTQPQIRKYREQHRHAGGINGAICIAITEHDSSRVPQSTSVPRELKYVANPRGPPVYGRDADVPLLEVDAPADLLERLRYSIAPRGPSLATVETQSPDFTFSSGPRMSPEKVSTELAI